MTYESHKSCSAGLFIGTTFEEKVTCIVEVIYGRLPGASAEQFRAEIDQLLSTL